MLKFMASSGVVVGLGRLLVGARSAAATVFQRGRTIKLSKDALRTPLPRSSWLQFYREFISRSGPWRDYPTGLDQSVLVDGVVQLIGPDEKVIGEILGFGKIDVAGDGPFSFGTNNCSGQYMVKECAYNGCAGQSCDSAYECGTFECNVTFTCSAGFSCDRHHSELRDVLSQLEAHWTHPFVEELREQFGARSTSDLARAVGDFMGRNGYAFQ